MNRVILRNLLKLSRYLFNLRGYNINLQIQHLSKKKNIILMYHGFTEERVHEKKRNENDQDLEVNIEIFRLQIEYLKKHYNIISLDHLIKHYYNGLKIPDNSIVLTMDDGYESNYTLAYPILKEYDIPATIFVTTSFINHEPSFLNWNQIKEMVESGLITIGSHTSTHVILSRCNRKGLVKELSESKKIIEEKTGIPCNFFCYPNGEKQQFNSCSKEMLKETGYLCGLTTIKGMNDNGSDLFKLKRVAVDEHGDLIDFIMVLSGAFILNIYYSIVNRINIS